MEYLFYCLDSQDPMLMDLTLDTRYSSELWKPSLTNVVPRGTTSTPFAVWWMMYQLHIFKNKDYRVFIVYEGKTLVHRSGVFPRYFRFPFMAQEDLQIGDLWTHSDHRNKGLATYAIQEIVNILGKPGRRFWYVVEKDNFASIRVIEKSGFVRVGEGIRTKRFGVSLLGSYVLNGKS